MGTALAKADTEPMGMRSGPAQADAREEVLGWLCSGQGQQMEAVWRQGYCAERRGLWLTLKGFPVGAADKMPPLPAAQDRP